MSIEVTPPNSVHMLWLFPQYFVMAIAEVMFSITGLQFSFTQVQSIHVSLNLFNKSDVSYWILGSGQYAIGDASRLVVDNRLW